VDIRYYEKKFTSFYSILHNNIIKNINAQNILMKLRGTRRQTRKLNHTNHYSIICKVNLAIIKLYGFYSVLLFFS